jgi:orotidine-5'-phosphate decarboxylase
MPILIPGIGAQGGDIAATVAAGKNSRKQGMIINSARDILYASNGKDFAQAAREATQRLRDTINSYRP